MLTAGAARADITPTELTALNPMGGTTFTAIHDRLHLRGLVASDGDTELALLSADLIEVGDMTAIRSRIEAELGIPADHIIIAASHSHNAPRLGRVSPGAMAHNGGPEVDAYTEHVYGAMIDVLRRARESARPARLGLETGTADVNVNRDERVDGKWVIGYNPDGPSDKTVWVVRFETTGGEPIAVLFNYAVHSVATLGTGEVSADLAGAAARYVENQLGCVALWTAGPLGDQICRVGLSDPFCGPTPEQAAWAYRAAEAQGLLVGAEVVRVAGKIRRYEATARLHAVERVVACPVKRRDDLMKGMIQEDVPTVDLRMILFLLGDIALAGVGGEVVTPIYERLRRQSPLAATIVVSLANDRIGYLADDAAYDRWTFEVNGSPVKEGYAETAIADGFTDMITEALHG